MPITRDDIFPHPSSQLFVIIIFIAKEEDKGTGKKTRKGTKGQRCIRLKPMTMGFSKTGLAAWDYFKHMQTDSEGPPGLC